MMPEKATMTTTPAVRFGSCLLVLVCLTVLAGIGTARALDPPHDWLWPSRLIDCSSCHMVHAAVGGAITAVAGNVNLCQSCHRAGGMASAKPMNNADEALPGPGLPLGETPSGTSHRWDSGPAGHVVAAAGNSSSGEVQSGGDFTGAFATTYTIVITGPGAGADAGVATFDWADTLGGGGTGLLTGIDVVLAAGVTVTFTDGPSSPSFVSGDQWKVYVRTDLDLPLDVAISPRVVDGKIMCSSCHDEHSQARVPFDSTAPAYNGSGSGEGRHFQRTANDVNQMCVDCHRVRNLAPPVPSSGNLSHPVGMTVPGTGDFQAPSLVPLAPAGEVVCMTCHAVHGAPMADGTLLRVANNNNLCTDCHTLADYATPAAHFDSVSGVLWPGGQYGSPPSTFPQITDGAQRGWCSNCHQVHGWPDAADTTQDYPGLLVEGEENLCYTCHDGSPAPDIMSEFSKSTAHPVGANYRDHNRGEPAVVQTRHAECPDCHNTHQAKARVSLPGPTTSPRPASGPIADVRGVSTSGTEVNPASYEYQLCFRCHGDSLNKPAAPTQRQFPSTNVRMEFNGSMMSFHTVAVQGQINDRLPSLKGGWSKTSYLTCTACHNNNSGPANGGGDPNGPHGSTRPHLLERRYETADNQNYSAAKYAMCLKCHDQNSLRNDESFSEHKKHFDGEKTPCNVCHDPHGSAGQRKLINFDTSVVQPWNGRLEFVAPEDSGNGKGYCYLICHGETHKPKDYKP